MRVVVQRVKSSQVTVNGQVVGKIGQGLNLLVGIADTDTAAEAELAQGSRWSCLRRTLEWMARKCLELRLFPNEESESDRWQKSVQEIGGDLLVVIQFTLYGDCRKGRRPSFDRSAPPELARNLYEQFIAKLRQSGLHVATGEVSATMQVSIENDGPITLLLDR